MEDKGLLIVALVAIVSVVGLIMFLETETTGNTIVYFSGEGHRAFDRPFGSSSVAVYGLDENLPCWTEDGRMFCPEADTASPPRRNI